MEFLDGGRAGAPPMSHLPYTTWAACARMQLSGLLEGMENSQKNVFLSITSFLGESFTLGCC